MADNIEDGKNQQRFDKPERPDGDPPVVDKLLDEELELLDDEILLDELLLERLLLW